MSNFSFGFLSYIWNILSVKTKMSGSMISRLLERLSKHIPHISLKWKHAVVYPQLIKPSWKARVRSCKHVVSDFIFVQLFGRWRPLLLRENLTKRTLLKSTSPYEISTHTSTNFLSTTQNKHSSCFFQFLVLQGSRIRALSLHLSH